MLKIAELIGRSPEIFALISFLDSLVYVLGCAFIVKSLFHLSLRKSKLPYIICGIIVLSFGIADAVFQKTEDDFIAFLWSTACLLMPYVCMILFFRKKGIWKAFLATFGYTIVEAVKFIVQLVFFGFDNNNRNEPLELLIGFIVDVVFFLGAYLLLTRYINRRYTPISISKNAAILFFLAVGATAMFVSSLLLLGTEYSSERQVEFVFMLMNIPVLAATIAFAAISYSKMRAKNEAYRQQLNMQIRQFEWMEKMYDELRIFKHDFPKKMRPLIAYLDEDKPDEAREMAEGFTDFVAQTGEKFHTGNFRLDTVLYCEQQIAQRDGIEIDVPFDASFPKEGIDPDDIYTIFPNALDNAIEACRNVEGERKISFRSKVSGNTVYVTIRNPVSGEVRTRNGLPQTVKKDKELHGFGFRSIKRAAAKYGDDNVSFSVENGVFELKVFLIANKTD